MRIPAASFARDGSGRRHGFLHKSLRDMTDVERHQWQAWLDAHGVVSRDMLVGTSIVCDDERLRIEVEVVDRDRSTGHVRRGADDALLTTTIVTDLRAPAAAMPGERS